MMKETSIKAITFTTFLAYWLILSPVTLFGEFNKAYEKNSPDGNYIIRAYYILPTTPLSLFQLLINKDVFLVLFDSEGTYLGQSSPFTFSDIDGLFSDTIYFPGEIKNEESFSINGANDYADGYTIPAQHKKWWSELIGLFY